MAAALHVQLDAPLPAELAVGKGTAVFVSGTCFSPAAPIASLTLVVDGEEQPVMAHGMPRLDALRAREAPTSYRSGFWALARVRQRAGREPCTLGLRARLADGGEAALELARIPLAEPSAPVSDAAPDVAICMATYEPPLDLLARQLDSIRAQTHGNWVCVVSDDCSDPETFAAIEAAVAGDERFVLSRSPRRLGFYRNFERALSLAPAAARYVALADQDDVWNPDKLATLLAEIGDARLIYSDARIVSSDGQLRAETYWGFRRNNHADMLSLLVTNSVTGAASLFRRDLLDDALPFPPAQFAHFHDHWIAVCALAVGDIRYVDRPLYDYVQHGGAYVGHLKANRMPSMLERIRSLRRNPRERLRLWRMHYFGDACRLIQ
ncbi:MAG TPA: glycosyltransferase family 2 protein, partial [Solirubrobacteraceae bacterium]|nr:glycosyltransferase family 2 protein [Solirubrobacteraceae bacterium]